MNLFNPAPIVSASSLRNLFAALFLFSSICFVHAAEQASADITSSALNGGGFDYTITLKDTGTTNIGTFWYSWVPGKDFLPSSPTGIVSPTDWTDNITNAGSSDGFAIQWISNGAPLTPGTSETFSFDSTSSPTTLAGDSPFFPTTPIGTSFVYSGGPFSDSGFEFVVAPEPSSVALSVVSVLFFLAISIWKKHAGRPTTLAHGSPLK